MRCKSYYNSPLGRIVLKADDDGLSGLGFEDHMKIDESSEKGYKEHEITLFKDARRWLDIYFRGIEPDFDIPVHISGSAFQEEVWNILLKIPYGKTVTYGEIAEEIAAEEGIPKMSAQAVGGAVGRNKISIIIPCHRVIGANGNLTGYGSGIPRKIELLKLEGVDTDRLYVPKSRSI